MSSRVGACAGIGRRLLAAGATLLILGSASLTAAAPAAADRHQCSPAGVESATVLPANLSRAVAAGMDDDTDTTATVVPLSSINVSALGLGTPGVLTVGTLSDAPPNVCINSTGRFTGFDNELLRAIAAKLGLHVRFVGTDFSGLLAQVASRRFDIGSASVKATDARRRTVVFTNGYDFGYYSLVVPPGSAITSFTELAAVSVSAWSKARSRSPTSSTPCTCNR